MYPQAIKHHVTGFPSRPNPHQGEKRGPHPTRKRPPRTKRPAAYQGPRPCASQRRRRRRRLLPPGAQPHHHHWPRHRPHPTRVGRRGRGGRAARARTKRNVTRRRRRRTAQHRRTPQPAHATTSLPCCLHLILARPPPQSSRCVALRRAPAAPRGLVPPCPWRSSHATQSTAAPGRSRIATAFPRPPPGGVPISPRVASPRPRPDRQRGGEGGGMGACVSRPSACVGKPHTPRSGDAAGRSAGGSGARRRRSRRAGKGRRKTPSRAASMETIQEAEVPGSPSGAAAAADHRTYSNPAFQGGWVGGRMGCFLLLLLSLSATGAPPARCLLRGWILISGGPWARDCALLGVKLNYCISLFLIRSSRKLVLRIGRVGLQLVVRIAVRCVNSYSLVQFDLT